MDEHRTHRSPAGERFMGMFSSPSTPSSSPTEPSFVAGDELHEDDFLFSSSPDAASAAAAAPAPAPAPNDAPRSPGRGAPPPGHLGLLAALAMHDGDRRLLVRRRRRRPPAPPPPPRLLGPKRSIHSFQGTMKGSGVHI
ncbi:unnamed protein product [Urochloa humidicola]